MDKSGIFRIYSCKYDLCNNSHNHCLLLISPPKPVPLFNVNSMLMHCCVCLEWITELRSIFQCSCFLKDLSGWSGAEPDMSLNSFLTRKKMKGVQNSGHLNFSLQRSEKFMEVWARVLPLSNHSVRFKPNSQKSWLVAGFGTGITVTCWSLCLFRISLRPSNSCFHSLKAWDKCKLVPWGLPNWITRGSVSKY